MDRNYVVVVVEAAPVRFVKKDIFSPILVNMRNISREASSASWYEMPCLTTPF